MIVEGFVESVPGWRGQRNALASFVSKEYVGQAGGSETPNNFIDAGCLRVGVCALDACKGGTGQCRRLVCLSLNKARGILL